MAARKSTPGRTSRKAVPDYDAGREALAFLSSWPVQRDSDPLFFSLILLSGLRTATRLTLRMPARRVGRR